ncbi:sensor histidine kinase [Bacillus xiapuensis]|uniref:sensor histidine kinase n=1 Tax=Bacillus xiapuensis TaxID=2014075 RepID=UPI000C231126|nr:sensor histidine kinase [Bacillus xiapuensis]
MGRKKWNIQLFPKSFGILPYIFLLYVIMPAYNVMNETGWERVLGAALLFLFLITYRQLYVSMGEENFSFWLAFQMLIVFIFSLFFHVNMIFMGFFPANFIGWYEHTVQEQRKFKIAFSFLILIEVLPLIRWGLLTDLRELAYFFPFLIVMLLSPFGVRSINKQMQLEKQLDEANEQINELVKREERLRISRDLHDTLGHTLSLIALKSQLVERLIRRDADRAENEAKEIEKTSRAALKQVRELVASMRAITIADELIHVEKILQAAGIAYHCKAEMDLSEISPLFQSIISMCLREAATNVVKHSQAENCMIQITRSEEEIRVEMKDDGVGVGVPDRNSSGLKGMEERLALVGGSYRLINQNGALLAITVPVIKKEGVCV